MAYKKQNKVPSKVEKAKSYMKTKILQYSISYIILYHNANYNIVLHHIFLCYIVQYYIIMHHYTSLHVSYYIIQHIEY